MKLMPLLLIFGFNIISDAKNNVRKRDSSNQQKVVCYYMSRSVDRPDTAKFTPKNINPYLCTHLIYAFGYFDKENGLTPSDKDQDIIEGGYEEFNGLKTYNKNLKTLLAIEDWNEGFLRFSKFVDDEDKRNKFVKTVIKFLREQNFDGLDLNWEYPNFRIGKLRDKDAYVTLVKELRKEFNRESSKTGLSRLLLTMAVPKGIDYIDTVYVVPELNKHLDFMNLLTYDYHSSYEPAVNHHSPLYPLEEDTQYNFDPKQNTEHTIKNYIDSGADKEKLVLGIPTYGRSYTLLNKDNTYIGAPSGGPGKGGETTEEDGLLAYYEICGNLKKDDTWTIVHKKPSAMGPYAYRDDQWVGYDDEEIVKLKAKYAKDNDLGGIMFFSIDYDDFRGNCHGRPYPLIEAGKEAFFGDSKVESSQGKETKTTPEPPTTPDTRIVTGASKYYTCKDVGIFPHPRECNKYFSCLDNGLSNLVVRNFTCPSGKLFNKALATCDDSQNVVCNDNKTSETTTIATTTPKRIESSIKTTTTPTTQTPEEEDDVEDDLKEEYDPKEIKLLITLIEKLGGVAELEKQLTIKDESTEITTPAIIKSLYNKVLKRPFNNSSMHHVAYEYSLHTVKTRFQSSYINGYKDEVNDGEITPVFSTSHVPRYVSVMSKRISTTSILDDDDFDDDDDDNNNDDDDNGDADNDNDDDGNDDDDTDDDDDDDNDDDYDGDYDDDNDDDAKMKNNFEEPSESKNIKIQKDRTHHGIVRPNQRTTTTAEDPSIVSLNVNRRKKFRSEVKTTLTSDYEEES